jgi:hypothetical membrane protein
MMAQSITTRSVGTPTAVSQTTAVTTRALLAGGVAAGPMFIVVAGIQALTRPGFDIRRHAISMLSLGDLGWIQIANFVVTGVLTVACAVGMSRALGPGRGRTWGPRLIGAYGVGLAVAGVFRTDPALGFPPGSPAGMPAVMSWHAIVHSIAFFLLFASLIAACFVSARRFAALGLRRWAAYCAAVGVAAPALIVAGMIGPIGAGVPFFAAGVVAFSWVAALAAGLMTAPTVTGSTDIEIEPTSSSSPGRAR